MPDNPDNPTTMITIADSMVSLTCSKCGHTADFLEFCRTPITGELPAGTHQCPACRRAWRMEAITEGRWTSSGLYIPPGRRSVTIPTIL